MAIQQPQTARIQIIRRLLLLLAPALLLACKKEDRTPPELTASRDTVVLRCDAESSTTFLVTASAPWQLVATGEGFTADPTAGEAGESLVTLTATQANDGRRRELGSVTLTLSTGTVTTSVAVAQAAAVAQQTVLMYFPWSGGATASGALTSYFRQNIAEMERIVAKEAPEECRLLVYFMESASSAELFEIYRDNDEAVRLPLRRYASTPDEEGVQELPAHTTAEGIASILEEVRTTAPAQRYAMTIGCHGMGWIPASASALRANAAREPEREYWEYASDDRPLTRWFGGTSARYQTDIETLASGIAAAGMTMEYILFDDCYMSSVEVAYALREVARHLIGSTSEVMAVGFPYATMGHYLLGEPDYAAICQAFYDFYMGYIYPYGTIGVTNCSELKALAAIMRRINDTHTFDARQLDDLQRLDGYSPVRFFDLGDYVRHLCTDAALLAEFEEQLERTVPEDFRRNTPMYYSMTNGENPIYTFSGITTSDPSISGYTIEAKRRTAWWQATHAEGN